MAYDTDRGGTPQRNAWQKAMRLEGTTLVVWAKKEGAWHVPSVSVPGEWYRVWVEPGTAAWLPWWRRLSCSCPAGEAGYSACWHRARVALHWRREEERHYRHPS